MLSKKAFHKNQDSSYWRAKQEEVSDVGTSRVLAVTNFCSVNVLLTFLCYFQ